MRAFAEPRSALCRLKDHTPDLIVTDLQDAGDGRRGFSSGSCAPFRQRRRAGRRHHGSRGAQLPSAGAEAGATDFPNSPVDHHEFVTRTLQPAGSAQAPEAARRARRQPRAGTGRQRTQPRARHCDSIERLAVIDTLPVLINAVDRDGQDALRQRALRRISSA